MCFKVTACMYYECNYCSVHCKCIKSCKVSQTPKHDQKPFQETE